MKKDKFKVLLYLKKNNPDKSGKAPVMGRITVGRNQPFDATAVKELYQGSMDSQMTLLALLGQYIDGLRARIGVDCARATLSSYVYTPPFTRQIHPKEVQDERCRLRAVERAIHPGVPGFCFGRIRVFNGNGPPLPGHPEENL